MGKAKKHKTGSKAKKPKHGSKGKKGSKEKKGKKEKKGSSAEKKSSSASSTKGQSGTASSEPSTTSGRARGSISSTTERSAMSSASFKPLNRPPLPELVLPSDLESSTQRRPSIVYVWDWSNVWFFPASVFALAFIVLFMVYTDYTNLGIRGDELHAKNETAAVPFNSTNITADAETTTGGGEPTEVTRRKAHATASRRRAHLREPYDPASPSEDEWSASEKSAARETRKTSAASKIGGEEEDTADGAGNSEANMPPSPWLDAPTVGRQGASSTSSTFAATKAAVDADLPQNASTVQANDA